MNKIDKLKNFIKSIPFVGKIASKIYSILNFIKPGGQYWEYNFKAKKFDRLIRNIASLISDNGYSLTIKSDSRIFITLTNTIKFWWTPGDPYSLLGMPLRGDFEPECTFLINKLIKKGNTIVDIGGNFGWYSCHFAHLVGETGKVHVFEPTNIIDDLKNNLILNEFAGRCELNKIALGNETGSATLFIPKKLGTAFASLRKHNNQNSDDAINFSVNIEKLDDYVLANKIDKIDFIKIDIEGAEYLALKGAEMILEKYKPMILLEIQEEHTKYFDHSPDELITYLTELGYNIYDVDQNELGTLRKIKSFGEAKNYNFLALQNDHILKENGLFLKYEINIKIL